MVKFVTFLKIIAVAGFALPLLMSSARAQTCPFDDGGSSLAVEGVVLTRYALGLTGAPLVANTGINAVDAPTVEAAINCPACGLNITGNPTMTVADATIISRKLAGFSGAALTNGVALGSGTRSTPAAVQSFLLGGCGTAPSNAFVNGGNSFNNADAVMGTNDLGSLTVRSSGSQMNVLLGASSGLRMSLPNLAAPNDKNINATNGTGSSVSGTIYGATIGGGVNNVVGDGNVGGIGSTIGGGVSNKTSETGATVSGGYQNTASGYVASVSGGQKNIATGSYATVSGGYLNRAGGGTSTVAGGYFNTASGDSATVAGGQINTASGHNATVAGGRTNTASGFAATVAGGQSNAASGDFSFAAGVQAKSTATGQFTWADSNNIEFNTAALFPTTSRANTFNIRATGGLYAAVAIDGNGVPTWGCYLTSGGGWVCSSDRSIKANMKKLDGKDVLKRLLAMPVFQWQPKDGMNQHLKHFGPMAQDFYKAFGGLGGDDKAIGLQDADGVALAAIQGLNQKLIEQVKTKDGEIAKLQRKISAIEKRLGLTTQ